MTKTVSVVQLKQETLEAFLSFIHKAETAYGKSRKRVEIAVPRHN